MNRGLSTALTGTGLLAALTVATAFVAVPPAVRVTIGLLMVFVVPGFAFVCAVLPERQLSFDVLLFASLGASLTLAACAAVLLAALPIGLSRKSFAVALGVTTVLSAYAAVRSRSSRGTSA